MDDPKEGVQKLALGKALAAVAGPGLYLGSDTVVVLNNVVMGKPADPEDAKQMLSNLSGRTHEVCTGVALVTVGEDGTVENTETFVEATEVTFFELSDEEIDWYVGTGEPMDKAGAYGIQGLGRVLVEGIRGDYETVVGLPAARVYRALREHDVVPS